ncbi:MAG: exodeoxyribonuclease VII large subunit [Lachnospiraceae bacterium]|nr:exodeoxyribonuclease VII large subunit [Lachnospiraceae bacterium]
MKTGKVYSVSQVNSYIKSLIVGDVLLSRLEIKGELSNVKKHPSGHIYFTLKDEEAAISCVMFASDAASLQFEPENGSEVVAAGHIGVYEKTGVYQLYVKSMRPGGSGQLYERFLKLKEELEEMGMFDRGYKQEIPPYVLKLGVVTASTGAAVRDIINVSKRRNPFISIFLYPAQVQGEGAAESIVKGIKALDSFGVDVIIVGRGGGSIEDLWAFNEEITARAIFDCKTPVISAVGHETDTTIADFVADLRAPTPSAAAELAVFDYSDFEQHLGEMRLDIKSAMAERIKHIRLEKENYHLRLQRMNPINTVAQKRLRLDGIEGDLRSAMKLALLRYSGADRIENDLRAAMRLAIKRCRKTEGIENDLRAAMKLALQKSRAGCELYAQRLKAYDPEQSLRSGFAFVQDDKGRPVKDTGSIKKGDELTLIMKDGRVYTNVREIEKR